MPPTAHQPSVLGIPPAEGGEMPRGQPVQPYNVPSSTLSPSPRTSPTLSHETASIASVGLMELGEFRPDEIKYLEQLRDGDGRHGPSFLVKVDGELCVMKVYHRLDLTTGTPDYYTRELNAYRRLANTEVYTTGHVPRCFGFLEVFDTARYQLPLNDFDEDDDPPSAIFLEYIADLKMLDLPTYTPERLQGFVDILRKIHAVNIIHNDLYLRNMLFVEGEPDRIVCLDFDASIMFNDDPQTREERDAELLIETERLEMIRRKFEHAAKVGHPKALYSIY